MRQKRVGAANIGALIRPSKKKEGQAAMPASLQVRLHSALKKGPFAQSALPGCSEL